MTVLKDRALGCLYGLALGDALGMPTQSLSPDLIVHTYGPVVGLLAGADIQPYAPGLPAGTVTDDTEQALIVADLLIGGGGHIAPEALAHSLLAWEQQMRERGSHDLLGPSTKAALEQVRAGADPRTTGTSGTTNGAAMRVAPVGIAWDTGDTDALLDAVYESCLVTHNTRQGFEGAAVVALAVSALLDGQTLPDALYWAVDEVEAAQSINPRGEWAEGASVLTRARWALSLVMAARSSSMQEVQAIMSALRDLIGTSVATAEAVPCALALASFYADRPLDGLLAAANLGGDTDTIGAIAGALLGAANGYVLLPPDLLDEVTAVNDLDIEGIVDALLAVREAQGLPSALRAGEDGWKAPELHDDGDDVIDDVIDEGITDDEDTGDHDKVVGSGVDVVDGVPGRVHYTGQVIVDLTMTVDHLPEKGGDIFASSHQMCVGGGFNVLHAARQMGAEVVHHGALGEGPMADAARAALSAKGVTHHGPTIPGVDTGYCVALTEPDAERSFVSTVGAEAEVPEGTWDALSFHEGDVLHLCGYSLYHPRTRAEVERLVRRLQTAATMPRAVLFDVGPMIGEAPADTLTLIGAIRPLWSINEREAYILARRLLAEGWRTDGDEGALTELAALLGEDKAPAAGGAQVNLSVMAEVLSRALGAPVLVRAGQQGAWWAHEGEVVAIPTPSVTPVDSNGAGDAHAGALCAALAAGESWQRALLVANCAGALSTQFHGPATCPSRAEVESCAAELMRD